MSFVLSTEALFFFIFSFQLKMIKLKSAMCRHIDLHSHVHSYSVLFSNLLGMKEGQTFARRVVIIELRRLYNGYHRKKI